MALKRKINVTHGSCHGFVSRLVRDRGHRCRSDSAIIGNSMDIVGIFRRRWTVVDNVEQVEGARDETEQLTKGSVRSINYATKMGSNVNVDIRRVQQSRLMYTPRRFVSTVRDC